MQGSHTTSARVFFSGFSFLILGSSCGSCGRGSNAVVDVQVLDRMTVLQGSPIKIDHDVLERNARDAVKALGGFELREGKPTDNQWQLTVEVELAGEREAREPDGGALIEGQMHKAVRVAMSLVELKRAEGSSGTGATDRFDTEATIERDVPKGTTYDALAADAVQEGAEALRAAIELRDASDSKVIDALSSKNHGTRLRAIGISGERKLKNAVPPLVEIVKNEDEDQGAVLKAIGALVAIGDDRAVGALIDAGRRRSNAYLNQILFAVAALGGKEAEAYLFTVANGHADPEVRKNANDALEELSRRKDAKNQKRDATKKEE
jgi:hypothetical protein